MKNEIIRKLSSRKFWAALGAFAVALCALLGVDELTVEKLAAVIGAFLVLWGYIFTEGKLDSQSMDKSTEKLF